MQDSLIVNQFSKHKPCYYCGAPPPSSREHAPVKSMLRPFECDSVTVPSCDEHNTDKNLDDRAIVTFFLKGLYYSFKTGALTTNQIAALQDYHLDHAQEVELDNLVMDPEGKFDVPLSHIDDTHKVMSWTRNLTAAIIWSGTGEHDQLIDWDNAYVWSPEYVEDRGKINLEEAQINFQRTRLIKEYVNRQSIHWWSGWSAYPRPIPPDIYRFEISQLPHQFLLENVTGLEMIIRHIFYGKFSWYVWFSASQSTWAIIMDKIIKVNREV